MSLVTKFRSEMTAVGQKRVTHTDVSKAAYVPNQAQRDVLSVAGFDPEIRMGRGLVNWIREGDQLLLGTDGDTVFPMKKQRLVDEDSDQVDQLTEQLRHQISLKRLVTRARAIDGGPERRRAASMVFACNLSSSNTHFGENRITPDDA